MAEGDALAKQLGMELSRDGELAKWLAEPDLVRRLVAALNLIAEGSSPRPVLGFLVPSGDFAVVKAGQRVLASPKSYARYETVTRVVSGINPDAAANAYRRVKPFAESAFAQIGRPGQTLDKILHQAIANLASTPIPESEPELEEKGLVYAFKDPKLEQLSGAQKQLLRMGRDHGRTIQTWLRKLDEALAKPPP
jgi:hypothetical protein